MENALSSLALDLSHDGISLHRLESGTWIVLDHIPLQVGTLKANMSRLRDMAQSTDGKVLVWMPMEQIHVLPVQIAGLSPSDQNKSIQSAFAESNLFSTSELEFDTGQMASTGLSPVAAIESGVLAEARDFLADHGFEATTFSTRTPIDAFGAKPVFSQNATSNFLASRSLAAVAGIALAVGFGGVIWNSLDLFRSAHNPDFEIVASLTAPDQERAPSIEVQAETQPLASGLPATDASVSLPRIDGDFAAFYAFPEDENSIQISINPVAQSEEIDQDELLPGPDTTINAPPLIAALDPAQSGGTIPNIFTSHLQETVDALLSPFGDARLEVKTPMDLLPVFHVSAPDALFVRAPGTSDAGFSAPVRDTRVVALRSSPELNELPEYFPVYLQKPAQEDILPEAETLADLTETQDQRGPAPIAAEASPRPESQDAVEITVPENNDISVALNTGTDDTRPLVPLLPSFSPVEDGSFDNLPRRAENLPPPVSPALSDIAADNEPANDTDLAALPEATGESNIEPNSVAELSASPDAPIDEAVSDLEPVVTSALSESLPTLQELEVASLSPENGLIETAPVYQDRPVLVTPDGDLDAAILDPEAFANQQAPQDSVADPANETEQEAELPDETGSNEVETAVEEVEVIPEVPPIVPPVRPTPPEEVAQDTEAQEDVVAALIEEALQEAPDQDIVVDSVRPRPRPESLAAIAQPEAGTPPADAPVRSLYALSNSERPKNRPAGFASRVVSVATAPTVSTPSAPSAPRVQLPTSASVQEAATNAGAINLRNVNLIGVSGSDGRRTALIRMPNGKIVSVNTGDKFSGYQVAAIGRNAIRIRKNGRDTVLEIPN